jgi:membrane protein YdbS with pleckstrin-like domain
MVEYVPLAARARTLFYLQAFARLLFFWVPVSIALAVASAMWFGALKAAIGALIFLFGLFLAAVWLPSLAFERWGYAILEEEVLITSGVLIRRITAIPTSRIQHVDMRQGLIEQWLGLGRVQIHTASGLSSDGVIPGLLIDDAEAIRNRLVARVKGDDGV